MRMDAPGYETMTFLRVFMGTGNFRCPFGIAAGFVMRRVVFAQATCAYCNAARLPILLGQHGLRAEGKEHCAAEQQAQYPFFQFHLVLPFFRTDCTVF